MFVLCPTSVILVVLRVVARIKRSEFRKSDYINVATCLLSIIYLGVSIVLIGAISQLLSGKTLAQHINTTIVALIFLVGESLIIPLTKMSIVFLLLEIEYDRKRILVLRALVVMLSAQSLILPLMSVFTCGDTPDGRDWTILTGVVPATESLRCVPPVAIVFLRTFCSGVAELTIFALAIILVSLLRLSAWQKAGVLFSFALGIVLCVASALGAYYENLSYDLYKKHKAEEATLRFFYAHVWLAVEIYFGIILAALMPIRAQFVRAMKQILRFMGWSVSSQKAEVGEDCEITRLGIEPSSTRSEEESDVEAKSEGTLTTSTILTSYASLKTPETLWSPSFSVHKSSGDSNFIETVDMKDDSLETRKASLYAV